MKSGLVSFVYAQVWLFLLIRMRFFCSLLQNLWFSSREECKFSLVLRSTEHSFIEL